MTIKIKEWFTPIHTIALIFVLIGISIQFYIMFMGEFDNAQTAAFAFITLGVFVEILGQALGEKK